MANTKKILEIGEVDQLGQFMDIVRSWQAKVLKGELWFRGQRNAEWDVEPGLCRAPYAADPFKFEVEFRALHACCGPGLCSDYPSSLIDKTVLMQHHGCPTRLLDWTEASLVAMYFAVCKRGVGDDGHDGAVYMLSPFALSSMHEPAFTRGGIVTSEMLRRPEHEQKVFPKELPGFSFSVPVPFFPAHTHSRIVAQKGRFTIHTFEPGAFNRVAQAKPENCIVKLRIRSAAKEVLFKQVTAAGITETTISQTLTDFRANFA